MKAIIVFRRTAPRNEGSLVVEEENLQRELSKLRKYDHDVVCILHVSFALRVRYVEFPDQKEAVKA